MYIAEVIPFSKSFKQGTLSYFTTKDISIGSIVKIDLRKKLVYGLVVGIEDGSKLKDELKSSTFKLRKIKEVIENRLFRKEFLRTANDLAKYFATGPGAVIETLTPSKIFESIDKITEPKKPIKRKGINIEKYIIQDRDEERFSHYKSLIREEFAKKSSIFIICPTIEDSLFAQDKLQKGIESHVFIIHGSLTKNQMLKTWNDIIDSDKPVLVITTGTFLSIPRHDIGTIIVDRENSRLYKTQRRPYLDIRLVAETYAKNIGARFFLGDILLRSQTLWRYDNQEFSEYSSLKFRSLSGARQSIIDMREEINVTGEIFSSLSGDLRKTIEHSKEHSERTFIFASRKGLAPSVVCSDCGTIVICRKCSAPVVLHGKDASKPENYFRCHHCGTERSAGETCTHCNSWRLKTLGIGIEGVAEEFKKLFPKNTFFVITSDVAKTPKQAREIISQFYSTPGSTLIGTEMALLYLHKEIENTAVASIDSRFAIPDFQIREHILNTLLRIRSLATQTFVIQTRKINDSIFEHAIQGNLADFYRDEFQERKKFNYPPFSILVKITISGDKTRILEEFSELKEFLEPYELITYPGFIERIRDKHVLHGIIKIPREAWIDMALVSLLSKLPPQFRIIIDAESLL
ncbi:MAG: primosomal protein N' (replication factor Y) [Candidatus Paceibacteria bacterium]|jgi:primosomal protein N' (replication factor Y)